MKINVPPLDKRTAPMLRRIAMTSEDFVDEFNKQFPNVFHAIADNHGNIKILNRPGSLEATAVRSYHSQQSC